MYKYSFCGLTMSHNASALEAATTLAELTGFDVEFILREIRNMKHDSEVVLMGEGGSIGYIEKA